ncbi:N-acetyltransferase [Fibrisoma montanum]|uniref:N-acetyltransferase n=1 Tax=Fibrisoma montanum TaxID=2305895 RepID=A0A418MCB4_9BACT|nr:GNAT family N-acetyltransferase [Fibrisoma montanum]RIV24007.1 N-acetyltransferase [Fibrisoma montanum]
MHNNTNLATTGRDAPANTPTIRPAVPDDVPALKALIDAVELFPSEMLDAMMADYFDKGPDSDHYWLTDDDEGPVGVAYYAPERLTEGTWNLYLIAIHPDRQGQGRGAALLRYVEDTLAARGERILLVETSGIPEFDYQRAFYRKCGYDEEARIRDFYKAGDDKVIFRKALSAS